jgi:hypothetical protein
MDKEQLKTIWERHNFPGANNLWNILRKEKFKAKYQDVLDWYNSMETVQLHKQQPSQKKYERHISTYGPCVTWQVDLLDMQNYSRSNHGYKYIFIGIDIYNRMGFGSGMKNKTVDESKRAFLEMIDSFKSPPKYLEHDDGSEYKGVFKKYCEEKSINQIIANSGDDHNKLGMINRFSRTMKESIYKYFTHNNTTGWFDHLEEIIKGYNNTPNINLCKMTPIEAHDDPIAVRQCIQENDSEETHRVIEIGDTVRTKLKKNVFDKGYEQKWSKSTFKVKDIVGNNYILDNDNTYSGDKIQVIPEHTETIQRKVDVVKQEKTHGKIVKRLKKTGLFPVDEKTGEFIIPKHLRPIGKGISFIPIKFH